MRMTSIGAALLLLFAVHPAQADTSYVNGNALLERCLPDAGNPSEMILRGNCLGYVAAAVDTWEIAQSANLMDRYYCMPDRVSVDQLRAIAIKYIIENPSERHNIASSLILKSLIQAFPCS